jgi:hypothetical protein
LLFGRCKETAKLHADRVHPHSKGGSTTVANGQLLCTRHNKQKAARIPFNWELGAWRNSELRTLRRAPAGQSSGAQVGERLTAGNQRDVPAQIDRLSDGHS